MNKIRSIGIIALLVLTSILSGCGDPPKASTPAAPAKAVSQQSEKFMSVTVSQFVEKYNSEISRRHGAQYVLSDGSSVKPTAMVYSVPEGSSSTMSISHNQSDNKVSEVILVIQGSQGDKFDQKTRKAWVTSSIIAANPTLDYDTVVNIRSTLLSGKVVNQNGIFYMADYSEKGAPFFQLLIRAE